MIETLLQSDAALFGLTVAGLCATSLAILGDVRPWRHRHAADPTEKLSVPQPSDQRA